MGVSDEEESGAKVVPFVRPEMALRVDRNRALRTECAHPRVEIRQRPRRLRCMDCKAAVDPFEYVLELAEEWERVFPKNEAARALEAAIAEVLAAHGQIVISDAGVTARSTTEHGAKLEAHENWGLNSYHGGVAATIVSTAKKLSSDAARWGAREVAYPRVSIQKQRGKTLWTVEVITANRTWYTVTSSAKSMNEAYDAANAEAKRLDKALVIEDRPRRLW